MDSHTDDDFISLLLPEGLLSYFNLSHYTISYNSFIGNNLFEWIMNAPRIDRIPIILKTPNE